MIAIADYGPQQSDFLQQQQEGTGQWLLDSAEYQDWCKNDASMLYCHGMPGAGKTIMTSIVVSSLCREFERGPGTGIAYLYSNFRPQDEQDAANLLANILKQLILDRPEMPSGVERLYERHRAKQTRPSLGEIVTELHSVSSAYTRSLIVVDALDECPISEGGRQIFISELLNLQTKARARVFVTSRINPQIARELGTGHTCVEIRASDANVQKYLNSQICQLPAFVRRSMDVQEELKTAITDTVNGM